MKKLKKILLINWLYFSKQLIEIENINFLTGKNGSGKSTIIDALQIVLLGELNSRNFNKAANEGSQRSLDGYLRADMDDKNPNSRRGKDFSSYIACEFWDDVQNRNFVIGIVFDCRGDGSRREQFFTYDGVIPGDCFLINRQAMEISALRNYLKTLPGAHAILYDSNKKYRDDISAKWNIHTEQVFRMLKKAVSFKPIVNIQQFITENICDIPDKPDIEAMQQNIRDYKHHEDLAQRQEEKLVALTGISKKHQELQQAIDRLQQQKFITLWAKKEDIRYQIDKLENERTGKLTEIEKQEKQFAELGERIQVSTLRKEQLITDRANSDIYKEETRLLEQKRGLEIERSDLNKRLAQTAMDIKREAQVLCSFCDKIGGWSSEPGLALVSKMASELYHVVNPFCECTPEFFSNALEPFEAVQKQMSLFLDCIRDMVYKLGNQRDRLKEEHSKNRAVIADLKRGVKDYPEGLLALQKQLKTELETMAKQTVSITILADVLEIAQGQDAWRGAIEGYLNTQKFYLLVQPEYFEKALMVYNRIKREFKNSFGLVDIKKMKEKENRVPGGNSLATKVVTENPLARSYIDYVLGRVVCCSDVKQLRNYHTAVTAGGMLYQGYVARPILKARMENTFIGQQAIAHRLERLEKQQSQINAELAQIEPIQITLERQSKTEPLFTLRFVKEEIKERQNQYLRCLKINKELESVQDDLSKMNLFWLSEIKKEIERLGSEIFSFSEQQNKCSMEKGSLEARVKELDYTLLPGHYQEFTTLEDTLNEGYSQHFCESVGIPRYKQELSRLRRAAVVAKNFGDAVPQTQNAVEQTKLTLFAARTDYVRNFQPCAFRIEVMDNEEFDLEKQALEESTLPQYREKIKQARESAMEQFQNDFLAKLKSSIDQVSEQVKQLNRALHNAHFGTDRYQFKIEKSPDFADYYEMIMAPELMEGESGLFALSFQQKYGDLIESLFNRIATSDDTGLNMRRQSELQKNIERFTDFRTYLKFDLETTDSNGSKQLLSQTLNTKSGGETQTPFYIAVLASFAQLYRTNDLSSIGNTMRLVVFDEAFNKMDSDRIIESVRLLRKMHLQAIICTPPDKLPDIMPEADKTFLVCKEKYNMHVLPYSKELEGL